MKALKNLAAIAALTLLTGVYVAHAQTAAEYITRAQEDQGRRKFAEMVTDAGNAIKIDPASSLGYFLRAVGNFSLDRNEEALTDVSKVIELDPTVAEAYFLHGSVLLALRPDKEWKTALADYDTFIRMSPDYPNAFRQRAHIHNEFEHNYNAAFLDAESALRLDPAYAGGYFERGVANWGLNRGEAAIADLRKAAELEPLNAKFREFLETAEKKRREADTAAAKPPVRTDHGPEIATAFYNMNNKTYDSAMPDAQRLFQRLLSHRYPAPKYVTFMGRTEVVDPFSNDKNELAKKINLALDLMRGIVNNVDFKLLPADMQQNAIERLNLALELQAEAARRHLVTLEPAR